MKIGKCKLCLKEKELLKKSHIIPNFMYKDLFDEKHSIVEFTTMTTSDSKSIIHTGEYDSNILCAECDNVIIGRLEDYASKFFYGGMKGVIQENIINTHGVEFAQISNLDYKKLKLFFLSLLWKASISKRSFFEEVDLGPYDDKIRKFIFDNDDISDDFIPCVVTSYRRYNLPKELISQPRKTRFGNNIGYEFLINGISYHFKINNNEKEPWILDATLNEKGEFKLIHMKRDMAVGFLNSKFGKDIFKQKTTSLRSGF